MMYLENRNHNAEQEFFGAFTAIRSRLDYTYHDAYDEERQLMQDVIIRKFLSRGLPTLTPLIIFTAGSMGVGKSFAMNHLEEKGILPIHGFVRVDPDELRACLPEYSSYVSANPQTAGFLTQDEAGLMAEILTHAALGCGMSVIVDGSLRDSSWYESHFRDLRRLYPKLRLSIFYVYAPVEDVYRRVKVRDHILEKATCETAWLFRSLTQFSVPRVAGKMCVDGPRGSRGRVGRFHRQDASFGREASQSCRFCSGDIQCRNDGRPNHTHWEQVRERGLRHVLLGKASQIDCDWRGRDSPVRVPKEP